MGKVASNFNVGDRSDITPEKLLEMMERMYSDLADAINRKPDIYQRTTDGQTSDTLLSNGDININSTTNKVEMLTNHVNSSTVKWTSLS